MIKEEVGGSTPYRAPLVPMCMRVKSLRQDNLGYCGMLPIERESVVQDAPAFFKVCWVRPKERIVV
jgi:hypothetical protein